jgi:hypothetical protein
MITLAHVLEPKMADHGRCLAPGTYTRKFSATNQRSWTTCHVDETSIGGHFYNVETQEISRLAPLIKWKKINTRCNRKMRDNINSCNQKNHKTKSEF